MKKEDRTKFALKRINQKRYTVIFAKGVDISQVNSDPFLVKYADWIFFDSKKYSGEIYLDKEVTIENIQNRFTKLFSLPTEDIVIKEKSPGLSNLYPL